MFFDKDAPHSRAKRGMLRAILQAFFGMFINKKVIEDDCRRRDYLTHYLDPFSGPGKYVSSGDNDDFDDPCSLGSPLVAIDACVKQIEKAAHSYPPALVYESKLLLHEAMKKEEPEDVKFEISERDIKCCRFVFSDFEEDHVQSLIKLVRRRFERLGSSWSEEEEEEEEAANPGRNNLVASKTYVLRIEEKGLTCAIRIDFYCRKFEELDLVRLLGRDATPLFSFVDPFGFSCHIDQIRRLVGSYKYLLLNLMVSTFNRFNKTNPGLMNAVFGGDSWKRALEEPTHEPLEGTQRTNFKLERLADAYADVLRSKMSSRTTRFAFRKGKSSADTGTLFYLMFACESARVLQSMKFAMQRHMQTKDAAFTDYYHSLEGQDPVPLGRKTNDADEAEVVYGHFRGRTVKLAEVKRFVLEETPYPFHSRPLGVLEKDGRISEVRDTDTDWRVRKGVFHSKLANFEVEDSRGNNWDVVFASEEEWKEKKKKEAEDEERKRKEKAEREEKKRREDEEREARRRAREARKREVDLEEEEKQVARKQKQEDRERKRKMAEEERMAKKKKREDDKKRKKEEDERKKAEKKEEKAKRDRRGHDDIRNYLNRSTGQSRRPPSI